MNPNLEILEKLWFNNPTMKMGEIIGVIIAKDIMTKETHAYIGKGVAGDAALDAESILTYGTKIDNRILKSMLS